MERKNLLEKNIKAEFYDHIDSDPHFNYGADEYEEWLSDMSMLKVRCNNCMTMYIEDDRNGYHVWQCDKCKSHEYLMDMLSYESYSNKLKRKE